MPSPPESITQLFILAVVMAWVLAIVSILLLRRYYIGRLDRLGESSSEEILEELESAYPKQRNILIRTQTEYLPYVFEAIRENIDHGFDDRQVQTLLERIEIHRPHEERNAVFPVETQQVTSDLRLSWTRDSSDRIKLRIHANATVIQALRAQKKKIPRAAYGNGKKRKA